MKRMLLILISFSVLLMFSGCGKGSLNAQTVSESNTEILSTVGNDEVDVDLTVLSSTMVYSEVYNMMSVPDDYIGKTVKMSGIFSSIHNDTTGNNYYACIIQDATACCAQGIEFTLENENDYPEDGDTICVIGTFDTYNEGQFRYSTLRNAKIV